MAKGKLPPSKTVSMPVAKDERVSVSVRPIKNGFVATHTRSGPKGYSSEEVYHPTKPTVQVGAAPAKNAAKAKSGRR